MFWGIAAAFFLGVLSTPLKPSRAVLQQIELETRDAASLSRDELIKQRTSSDQFRQLLALALVSDSRVPTLTRSIVDRFILNATREVSFLIYASAEASFCPYCHKLRGYFEDGVSKQLAPEGYLLDDRGVPTFFFAFNANQDKTLPMLFDLQSVPVMLHITPDNLECRDADKKVVDLRRPRDRKRIATCTAGDSPKFALRSKAYDSQQPFLQAIAEGLGREDVLQSRSRWKTLHTMAVVGVLAFGTALYFLDHIRTFIIRHTSIVSIIGVTFFWLSSSGLIYNLQHGMVLHGMNWKTGKKTYILPSMRSQYVLEGLIFSLLVTVVSFSFYTATNTSRLMAEWVQPSGSKRPVPWRQAVKSLATAVPLVVAALAYWQLRLACSAKLMDIKATFHPDPHDFSYGSPRVDRGYAF